MRPEHTCCPRPRYRWLTGASPRQSSWQTEWDQWLLQGVQDFSPPPGFVPSHTGADTNNTIVLICNEKTKWLMSLKEQTTICQEIQISSKKTIYKGKIKEKQLYRKSNSLNNQTLMFTLVACV